MFKILFKNFLSFLKNNLKYYFSKKQDFYFVEFKLKNSDNKILFEIFNSFFNNLVFFWILVGLFLIILIFL